MEEKAIIRQAKQEEAAVLAAIEAVCFPAAEAASPEAIRERLQAFPENFLAAELNGAVIGFINGGTTDAPTLPDELYHDVRLHRPDGAYQTVFGLDVLPEYRRAGVAGRLLDTLVQHAKERGKKGVVLTCKEHLISFYEKHGFVSHGVADSCHGGARWYDMKYIF